MKSICKKLFPVLAIPIAIWMSLVVMEVVVVEGRTPSPICTRFQPSGACEQIVDQYVSEPAFYAFAVGFLLCYPISKLGGD